VIDGLGKHALTK